MRALWTCPELRPRWTRPRSRGRRSPRCRFALGTTARARPPRAPRATTRTGASRTALPSQTFSQDLDPPLVAVGLPHRRARRRESPLRGVSRAAQIHGLGARAKCYLRNKLDPFSLTQIKREIQIHSRVAHRSIVPFYGSFEDERGNVYLLLQFTRRGDVFNNLSAGGVFSEETTRAEIIQPVAAAVAYLHTNGIMHRDIKPENLLVGEVGAGVSVDGFRLCRPLPHERCVTRLGTTDYMAPEIVRCDKARRDALRAVDRSGYGPEIDCWAIGILAFECLVGRAPFESDSTEETYRRILAEEPDIPERASPEARDFIRRCLEKDPNRRLGALQMLSHPWMVGARQRRKTGGGGSAAVMGARRGSYSPRPRTLRLGPDRTPHSFGACRKGTCTPKRATEVRDRPRPVRVRSMAIRSGRFVSTGRLEDGGRGGERGRKMDEEMTCAERFLAVLAADEAARPGPGSGASSLGEEPSDWLRSKSTGRLGAPPSSAGGENFASSCTAARAPAAAPAARAWADSTGTSTRKRAREKRRERRRGTNLEATPERARREDASRAFFFVEKSESLRRTRASGAGARTILLSRLRRGPTFALRTSDAFSSPAYERRGGIRVGRRRLRPVPRRETSRLAVLCWLRSCARCSKP